MEKFNPFSIEDLYKHYKTLVGLNDPLEPNMEREVKRAFMGGIGQLFVLLRSEIVKKTPEEAAILLEGVGIQIEQFWNQEAIKSSMAKPPAPPAPPDTRTIYPNFKKRKIDD